MYYNLDMYIYFLFALLSSAIAYIGSKTKRYQEGKKLLVVVLAALPLYLLSAYRYNVGTDYQSYMSIFNVISTGHTVENMDIGFGVLCKVISIFGGDFYSMIRITSLIFIGLSFYYIFYESPYPYYSIYLLFAMQYYFASFNGIRQMCGAAILLFSLKFVKEKKFIPFLLCVLLATSFHGTCLVFIPVYWFDKFKINPRVIFIVSLLVIFFGNRISNIINTIMLNTKYAYYAEAGGDGNNRIIWTLVQIAIVIFGSYYYRKEPKYSLFYNLQIVTMWLSFLNADVSWIVRIQWTFGMPGIIFIPYAISKSNIKSNKVIYFLLIGILFSIDIYLTAVSGKHTVLPYLTYLSNSRF